MAEKRTIQLDWRSAPNVETMLFKLYKLFVNADDTTCDKTNTQISDTRAKGAQQLTTVDDDGNVDSDGNDLMFIRYEKIFRRGWKSKRDKKYWAKWFLVLEDTVIRLSNFTNESQRLTGYMVARHNFPQQSARKILIDLALTIGVHPSALGSIAAAGGRVMVPKKLNLRLLVVPDVLQWLALRDEPDEEGTFCLTELLRVGNSWVDIPPLVLGVEAKHHRLAAVLVSGHRNLQSLISSYKVLNRSLDDVLFVLTGGFGDIPTREFLNVLSKHEALAAVPFLYVSEHDFQGFQIFFNLKYGSRNMAFLSQTQTCRQLEWIGPTIEDLDKVAEAGSHFFIKDQAQNHLPWTPEEQEAVRQQWLTKRRETTKELLERGENCQFNKKEDTRLMKHWREFNLLEKEPKLAAEALEIERSKHGKFRLSLLRTIYNMGIQWYIARQVSLRLNETVAEVQTSHLMKLGADTRNCNNERSSYQ